MRNASKILIIDISVAGHHPTYVRRILESELANSSNIVVASRAEMFSHPEIRRYAGKFIAHRIESAPDLAALYKDSSAMNVLRASWIIGRLYRKTYDEISENMDIGFVVVPFLDDCLAGLALTKRAFGRTPWVAITMRTMFHFSSMGVTAPPLRFSRLRRYLFERILQQPSLAAMLTIDPTLTQYAERQTHPNYAKIEYLPDPAVFHASMPSKPDARQLLAIPLDACVVLLYGEIAARKGVFALLGSAADEACNRRVHVLLAGRCEQAAALLQHPAFASLQAQKRLHRIDGFLDDQQERTALAASDCMWVGYSNFYLMSGVMVLAGRHGLPTIASRAGLIGYWTRENDLGITVDVEDRASVTAALNQLVAEPRRLRVMGDNGVRAFSKHEAAVLARLVAQIIARQT